MKMGSKFISERQCFRMGLMETITISMVSIPYLTLTTADGFHIYAFGLGLLLAILYGVIWYFYSCFFPEGFIQAVDNYMGWSGKIIEILYVGRYVLRIGLLVVFFAKILQQFLLRSFSIWSIVVPFLIICGYGALRSMENRGRLIELLFWWMFVPIILMVVFSISNLDWSELSRAFGKSGDLNHVFQGAYGVLLALSPMELALYNLTAQKKNTWKGYARFLIWMVLSLVMAYVVIVGILGGGWTKSSPTAAMNVMEAASLKSGVVSRFDYPVMAFWIIGVFATVSGFMHHTKEYICRFLGVKKTFEIRCVVAFLCVLVLVSIWGYKSSFLKGYLVQYLFYVDIWLGLLLPALVILVKKFGIRRTGKCAVCATVILVGVCISFFDGKQKSGYLVDRFASLDERQMSLEYRDYVKEFSVEPISSEYLFYFSIAELSEYKGEQAMETRGYSVQAKSLQEALKKYYKQQERQLDLGHVSCIQCSLQGQKLERLLYELGEFPGIPKSVDFSLYDKKYILREMIKAAYGRESL